ncbi:unnamed protein product [Musa acuminata subsp. malaccensis]|uniref:(wild Malaysian banana) hypothetical protein n=1 Tax=Musa acuminata subsp. malaccensis TaxID=214687 RepID=A0A8D7F8X6_MUSAM|nr:unnamed protein product [Musa acuminata subsp. malaccensis]
MGRATSSPPLQGPIHHPRGELQVAQHPHPLNSLFSFCDYRYMMQNRRWPNNSTRGQGKRKCGFITISLMLGLIS